LVVDDLGDPLDMVYYRSPTVSTVHPAGGLAGLQFYPNPATSTVHLDWASGQSRPFSGAVYDLNGLAVLEFFTETGEVSIPLNGMPAGSYFVKIQDGREVIARKLVIR
jgi:hypothetical protein